MALLDVRHLSKSFKIEGGLFRRNVGAVQALKDVSFEIQKGETLALVGGSGSGKSTVARIVAALAEADQGELLWEGQSMALWSRSRRAHHLQMIFQDPYASLNPKLSIATQLGEVVRLSGESAGVRERCVQLLRSVGLSEDALALYPFQFSGGQRQRIAIARALALKPDLLIADEPLSALDVTIQAQILDLFRQLKKDLGLTLLFITHDLSILPNLADRILVLENGSVVEEGPASQVLDHPRHAYTQALLDAVPRLLV